MSDTAAKLILLPVFIPFLLAYFVVLGIGAAPGAVIWFIYRKDFAILKEAAPRKEIL